MYLSIFFNENAVYSLIRNSLFGPLVVAKMWVQVGSKMAKKGFFIPTIFQPTQFSSKNKVFNSHSVPTLSKLKYELIDLHKILQKFIFD